MQNEIQKDRRILLINSIICFVFVCLSFIGLIFNEYALIICMLICGLISVVNTFLLLKSGNSKPEEGLGIKFTIFTLLRYILMIIGLVISAVVVYLTMGSEVNKYRYLMVALGALPYLVTPIVLVVYSR